MIAGAFKVILDSIALTQADKNAFDQHRTQIANCLRSAFDVAELAPFGSYARGCAIHRASDLDLLVVLRRRELRRGDYVKSSRTMLSLVHSALAQRFPTTAMGRDKQAIVVDFADRRSVDVVPAWWAEARDDGWPTYGIPDGRGEWMATSPRRHAKFIAAGDSRSGGKLKHVARILKYWRSSRTPEVLVSSFYAELLMARSGICPVGSSYA